MKTLHFIGFLATVLLILLITLGFTVEEISIINDVTSSDQSVLLATSYSGFYLAIKSIILTFGCYVIGIELYTSINNYYKKYKIKKMLDSKNIKDFADFIKTYSDGKRKVKETSYTANEVCPKEEQIDKEFSRDIQFDRVEEPIKVDDTKEEDWIIKQVDEERQKYWLNKMPVRSDYPVEDEIGGVEYRAAHASWTNLCPNEILFNIDVLQKYVDRYGNRSGDKQWLRDCPLPIRLLITDGYLKAVN